MPNMPCSDSQPHFRHALPDSRAAGAVAGGPECRRIEAAGPGLLALGRRAG
jgi:hypothetical protein